MNNRFLSFIITSSLIFAMPSSASQPAADTGLSWWEPASLLLTSLGVTSYFYLKNKKNSREQVKESLAKMWPHSPIKVFKQERDAKDCERLFKSSFKRTNCCQFYNTDYKRVLRIDDQLLGFIAYEDNGYIGFVAIAPQYHRMGLGKLLVSYAQEHLSQTGVDKCSLVAMQGTSDFYRQCGFNRVYGLGSNYMQSDLKK